VILNKFGKIAFDDWFNISQIRTDVDLDTFVIMPDHIHGIIKILPTVGATDPVAHDSKSGNINRNNKQFFNKTDDHLSHKKFSLNFQKSLQSNSISSIIGQYKSVVSKKIHKMGLLEFRWQRSFYDRIIRTRPELNAIRKYILENPLNYQK
jgi:REP element-mobilizing transposase RayT